MEKRPLLGSEGVSAARTLQSPTSILEHIDLSRLRAQGEMRPFRPGLPDTREFPIEAWESLRARLLRDRGRAA